MNGDALAFDPPASSSDSVAELRTRTAELMGLQVGQILLLHEGVELCDELLLSAMPSNGNGLTITAVTRPCCVGVQDFASHIIQCEPHVPQETAQKYRMEVTRKSPGRAFVKLDRVEFPPSSNININMMPFILGKKDSIPEEYQQYWPMIESCVGLRKEFGRVGFLTIHESDTCKGEPQRRGGVHVESPGVVMSTKGRAMVNVRAHWGQGDFDGHDLIGGIYMASSVPGSTKVWDVKVKTPVVGHLGDVEHLRDLLGTGSIVEAQELLWLTDMTPHESLPLVEDGHRQYFRVVTSSVSIWYANHSTPNRLGILPDPAMTKIVAGDKFNSLTSSSAVAFCQ